MSRLTKLFRILTYRYRFSRAYAAIVRISWVAETELGWYVAVAAGAHITYRSTDRYLTAATLSIWRLHAATLVAEG